MNIKTFLWGLAKPLVETWLTTRALVLPASEKAIIAAKYKIDPNTLQSILNDVGAFAVTQIDNFKP